MLQSLYHRDQSGLRENLISGIYNVAFKTPAGEKVVIAVNDSKLSQLFNIKFNGEWITTSLESGSVGTYVWQ